MKKIFTISILFLLVAFKSQAVIVVINQTNLTFNPNAIAVNVGDIVEFHWSSSSHTTTSALVPAGAATWDAPLNMNEPVYQYTVTVAGNYVYVCSFHNGMAGGFIASMPDAILEVTTEAKLTVSINAQSNSLLIHIESNASGNAVVKIIDITGRAIATVYNDEMGTGEKTITHEISALNRGIYFVHFSINGTEMTKKFIVG